MMPVFATRTPRSACTSACTHAGRSRLRIPLCRCAAWVGILAAIASQARAQTPDYTAVNLNPTGYSLSYATNINGADTAGYGYVTASNDHALLWTSATPNSYIDLNPAGFTLSYAESTNDAYTVGGGRNGSAGAHALLWTGTTASSYVDLNPTSDGFTSSGAFSVSGSYIVGNGSASNSREHALLWTGTTASSYVDLNPTSAGFLDSQASGTNGIYTVGSGDGIPTGGVNYEHALLWTGANASSYVDLNPNASQIVYSEALGIGGTYIVGDGHGNATGGYDHALLWTGTTASSYVDINPTGFISTNGINTNGTYTVGLGIVTGSNSRHALLWTGTTASSAIDLQTQYLAALGFTASQANSVDAQGNISGYGLTSSGSTVAFRLNISSASAPEPGSLLFLMVAALPIGGIIARRRKAAR